MDGKTKACTNCGEKLAYGSRNQKCTNCGIEVTTEHKDITSVIFESFKKAEPIIILASISLAIGPLVLSRNELSRVFDYSVLASFMFIFAFISYVIYVISKQYWFSEDIIDEEYSDAMFLLNLAKYAPIFFSLVGVVILLLIGYQFTVDSPGLSTTENEVRNPIPLFYLTALFLNSYLLFYAIFLMIKGLIKFRTDKKTSANTKIKFLMMSGIYAFIWLLPELNIISNLFGSPLAANFQTLISYSLYFTGSMGIIWMLYQFRIMYLIMTGKRKGHTKGSKIAFIILAVIIIIIISIGIKYILESIYVLKEIIGILEYIDTNVRNISYEVTTEIQKSLSPKD